MHRREKRLAADNGLLMRNFSVVCKLKIRIGPLQIAVTRTKCLLQKLWDPDQQTTNNTMDKA